MADFLTTVVLLLAPLFGGLYGEKERQAFQIVIAVAFAIAFLVKKRPIRLNNSVRLAAVVFAAAYAVSLLTATDFRESFVVLLRYISYLMVFWLVAEKAGDPGYRGRLFFVIYVSGALSVIVCMLIMVTGQPVLLVWLNQTVQTTFEYKNTGAVFLLVCSIIGLYWFSRSTSLYRTLLIGAGNYLLILTIVFTQSRAIWLLLPFSFILFLFGLDRPVRANCFAKMVITAVPSAYFGSRMLTLLVEGLPEQALALSIGGLVSVVVILFLWESYMSGRLPTLSRRGFVFVVTGAAVTMVIGALLSPNVLQKLQSISLTDENLLERLVMYKDAWKLFSSHWLTGTGGGGWLVNYTGIQSYAYYSQQVHNNFLQVMVETGLFGLIAYVWLWVAFYFRGFKKLHVRYPEADKDSIWLVMILGFILMVHSAFDFDLSFGAISFILWALMGIIGSTGGSSKVDGYPAGKLFSPVRIGLLSIGIMAVFFSVMVFTADIYIAKGDASFNEGELGSARGYYVKALRFDSRNAPCEKKLADVYLNLYENGDEQALDKAIEYSRRTTQHRPTAPFVHSVYSTALYYQGDYDGAVAEAEKFVQLYPLEIKTYEQLALTQLNVGLLLRKQGQVELADRHFKEVFDVSRLINAQLSKVPPDILSLWSKPSEHRSPVLHVSPLLKVYSGAAYLLLNENGNGSRLIAEAMREDSSTPVLLWNAVLQDLEHNPDKSGLLLSQASVFDPKAKETFQFIEGILKQNKQG